MGWYDDDGIFHRDAYDDDQLDMQDIGNFLEKHFHPQNTPQARKRREQRKEWSNMPRPMQESYYYSIGGFLLGVGIAWLLGHIFGNFDLLFFILAPLGCILAMLWKVIRVDEMAPDPKEITMLLLSNKGFRLCMLGLALCLIFALFP